MRAYQLPMFLTFAVLVFSELRIRHHAEIVLMEGFNEASSQAGEYILEKPGLVLLLAEGTGKSEAEIRDILSLYRLPSKK